MRKLPATPVFRWHFRQLRVHPLESKIRRFLRVVAPVFYVFDGSDALVHLPNIRTLGNVVALVGAEFSQESMSLAPSLCCLQDGPLLQSVFPLVMYPNSRRGD